MLIEGEKYACDACVRGHRVSNCQHSDRPLTHINKKGRPVSQCPHCRGLRKSRASHVKCECGDKPHSRDDCGHLEKGDSKSEHGDEYLDKVSDHSAVDHHLCCCSHGLRCNCALKKDYLDPVPELDIPEGTSSPSSVESRKPRLSTAQSESSITVFTNGHHKPVHKLNHAAHECGVPYKIPRPHSIHGHSEIAQRSMDHLPLVRSVDGDVSNIQDSINSAQQDVRLVRSEHGSPGRVSTPNFELENSQLPQLDLIYSAFNNFTSSPVAEDYTYTPNHLDSYFTTPDDQPQYSAALNMPPVDWSAFGLPSDNSEFQAAYSQPPSYASFDHSHMSRPGLTTSSSGEASEVEEFMPHGIPSPGAVEEERQQSSSVEQVPLAYRLDNTSSPYLVMPQGSPVAQNSGGNISLEDLLRGGTASPSNLEDFNSSTNGDPEALTQHGLTVQDAQKRAHPNNSKLPMSDSKSPISRGNVDPLWATSFNDAEANFDAEDNIPDNVWRS